MALGRNNLLLKGHLNLGTSFFHGAISFSFGGTNVNHVALGLLVAERFLNLVGYLDGVAFGFLVAVGFSFKVLDLDDDALGFAVINIDGLEGRNLNLNALLDFNGVRLLDNIGYVDDSTTRNLDIFANSLGTRDHLGDCPGDIFANFLGDLLTDRPLSSEM